MALSLSGTTGIVTGNIAPLNITTATIADDNVTTAKILNANVTYGKLSNSATEADNVAKRTAKAWVNFNGTNAFSPNPSTTAIRGSLNVSSITDRGTGNYTVNFTVAMSDVNYSALLSSSVGNNDIVQTLATSSCEVATLDGGFNPIDAAGVYTAFFR